jgi:hypothetical protein
VHLNQRAACHIAGLLCHLQEGAIRP